MSIRHMRRFLSETKIYRINVLHVVISPTSGFFDLLCKADTLLLIVGRQHLAIYARMPTAVTSWSFFSSFASKARFLRSLGAAMRVDFSAAALQVTLIEKISLSCSISLQRNYVTEMAVR